MHAHVASIMRDGVVAPGQQQVVELGLPRGRGRVQRRLAAATPRQSVEVGIDLLQLGILIRNVCESIN